MRKAFYILLSLLFLMCACCAPVSILYENDNT